MEQPKAHSILSVEATPTLPLCKKSRNAGGRRKRSTMEKSSEDDAAEIETVEFAASEIEYVSYGGEHHLPLVMNLVDQELSEPYSIFTYRYFVYLWPQLSFLVPIISTSVSLFNSSFTTSIPCFLNLNSPFPLLCFV